MILSIGMIVKNEEKYLEQCLSALKPILKEVDSELIIADTGSTDRTVEIAKKYTDKVFYFEWVNDFSAARNFTLKKAKGEWFMFIDADEILENCDNLINFFNSGEYKSYWSATYTVRSYSDINDNIVDKSSYTDFRPLRLTRISEEIAFRGAIHEALEPYYNPVKQLDVIADHYGYLFYSGGKSNDFARKKTRRNLVPLLEAAKKLKPVIKTNVSVYREIADCYLLLEDYDKDLEYLDKGLREVDPKNMGIIPYYSYKANTLLFLDRYDETISVCDKYFSKENLARTTQLATDVLMHFYRAVAYYYKTYYKEAIADFCEFFDAFEKYRNGKLNTNDLLYNSILVSNSKLSAILLDFYICCVAQEDYETARRYSMPYPIEGMFTNKKVEKSFLHLKTVIMNKTDYSQLPELYSQIDQPARALLLCEIRMSLFAADENKRRNTINILETVVKDSPAEAEAMEIIKSYYITDSFDSLKAENYLKKYSSFHNADILCFLLDKNADITSFVNAEDFAANECVHAVYAAQGSFFELLENYDINVISKDGLEKTAELYKYTIALAASKKTDIIKLMKKYGEIGLRWHNEFATSACASTCASPRELEAAVGVSQITSAYEKKDYKLCKNEMHGFLEKFHEFLPIITFYREIVEEQEKEALSASSKAFSEFEQMAITVKRNIREMIKAGSISDAENLLAEYAQLCPDDIEIKILKEQINSQK